MVTELAAYTVIGLTVGGALALAALGIVLVYRVTGVLNFANGAMGMFSTFVAWQVIYPLHGPVVLGVLAALAFSVVLGVALEMLVFRWLVGRPQLIKAVVTIGILLVLQSGASLIWGNTQYHLPINLVSSTASVRIAHVPVGYSQLLVMAVAIFLSVGLAAFLQLSRFGIAMRAVSDDPVAAGLWGIPVRRVGLVSWGLGSVVAAISGILISPFINFDTISLTLLVLDALAAALIGGLVSLPLTVVGGFALGLLETYPRIWIQSQDFPKLIALIVILAVLIFRARRVLLEKQG
jgi:branched-subunit amino acid ABC-type transport system permease component